MQPYGGQAVRLRVGEGAQQKRIDHAEDGRVGAYSHGHRENNYQSQAKVLVQRAQRVAKVLCEGVQHRISGGAR